MKLKILFLSLLTVLFFGCSEKNNKSEDNKKEQENVQAINKEEMAQKVKDEFLHAWNSYKEFAWGHDALNPLTGGFHDWYDVPLYMTPVDAYSTMYLMGLDEQMKEAKELIFKLDFDLNMEVQHFEISIRILGGLLSSYQLDGDERFLELAEDLATRMLPVWDSPTGMPYRYVNLQTGAVRDSISNPAEIGTYLPEYALLSELTGNPVFREKADKAVKALYEKRSKIDLMGTFINVETGEWANTDSHISGCIDSYYEYLLKSFLFTGDSIYHEMWKTHKTAVETYLTDTTEHGLWYGVANMNTGEMAFPLWGALDAFYAGVLCLDGDIEQAAMSQDVNFFVWTKFGVEPERFNYEKMEVDSKGYVLRPENIESAFYLYRFTGNDKYLNMGLEYYNSLVKYCRTDNGFSHVKDVTTMEKADAMESFFLAETLKYLYLIFAPVETFDFESHIFNTEAHPLKKIN